MTETQKGLNVFGGFGKTLLKSLSKKESSESIRVRYRSASGNGWNKWGGGNRNNLMKTFSRMVGTQVIR